MNELLVEKIFEKIKKYPGEAGAYDDMLSLCVDNEAEHDEAHMLNRKLRKLLGTRIREGVNVAELFPIYRKSLLFDAPYDFDCYMLYLEIDRKPDERFYQPRRKQLKPIVDKLQALADDELDELFVSEPPRVGKTTLVVFYITWLIGKHPEKANLYSAYSDTITKKFYDGVLEVLQDPITYKWHDVFPEAKLVQTNAAEETLNIDRKKRYPSLTCRSLYGTLNGACDCSGILVSDDLIGGIEEALNKERMISAWSKVDNNLLSRVKEKAKILWVGTRWSLIDPIGLRMDLLQNDERFKNWRFAVINVPALDENDESNFNYDYGVGFSTDKFRQKRASFERNNDMASWNAQYMGQPIEREGTLFSPGEFRFYNGELPGETPDRIFMAVDPAFGGGDYVASPVCFQYGSDIYVHDVVYSNEDKKITQPLLVRAVKRHSVKAMQVEANKSVEGYVDGVRDLLKAEAIRINLTTKPASSAKSKEQRIFDKAPDIRENFIFLEDGKRSKEYSLFMQNVFSFKMFAKNKNDDAPDSLAMAAEMAFPINRKLEVFRRTF